MQSMLLNKHDGMLLACFCIKSEQNTTDQGESIAGGPWLIRNRRMHLSLKPSDKWYAPAVTVGAI